MGAEQFDKVKVKLLYFILKFYIIPESALFVQFFTTIVKPMLRSYIPAVTLEFQ